MVLPIGVPWFPQHQASLVTRAQCLSNQSVAITHVHHCAIKPVRTPNQVEIGDARISLTMVNWRKPFHEKVLLTWGSLPPTAALPLSVPTSQGRDTRKRTGCCDVIATPSFGLSGPTRQVERAVPKHKTQATTHRNTRSTWVL